MRRHAASAVEEPGDANRHGLGAGEAGAVGLCPAQRRGGGAEASPARDLGRLLSPSHPLSSRPPSPLPSAATGKGPSSSLSPLRPVAAPHSSGSASNSPPSSIPPPPSCRRHPRAQLLANPHRARNPTPAFASNGARPSKSAAASCTGGGVFSDRRLGTHVEKSPTKQAASSSCKPAIPTLCLGSARPDDAVGLVGLHRCGGLPTLRAASLFLCSNSCSALSSQLLDPLTCSRQHPSVGQHGPSPLPRSDGF